MSMSLTPRIEHQIQEWIERGDYPDADAVVEDALRLLQQRKHATLQAKIQVGLDQIANGESIELTDEAWDELDRDADAALQHGEQPSPDVCP